MNWRFIPFVLLLWTLTDGKSTGDDIQLNDDPLPAANQNNLAKTVGKSIDNQQLNILNFLQKRFQSFLHHQFHQCTRDVITSKIVSDFQHQRIVFKTNPVLLW
jgi:hypothetical protein